MRDDPRIAIPDVEIESEAWDRLGHVYDPELALDLVNLGLIYELRARDGAVRVRMTLTTPGCPMSDSMPAAVERALLLIPGVRGVDVELVWEPPWSPDLMTDQARRELGLIPPGGD